MLYCYIHYYRNLTDLINFNASLKKSDEFMPIYFADPVTYLFQIGIINFILINQKA